MNVKLNLDFSLYKGVTKLKQWYKEVKAHFTQVQEAHNDLQEQFDTHAAIPGYTTISGHVKLSDGVNQTFNAGMGVAATPLAVKQAYDKAVEGVDAAATTQTSLDTEISDRQTADTTLQQNIDIETSARQTADTTLQNNINDEISARTAADKDLDKRVAAVQTDMYGGYIVSGSFSYDDFQVQVDSSYSYATVNVKSGKSITINGVQVSLPATLTVKPISPDDNVVQVYAEYDTEAKTITWYGDHSSSSWPYSLDDNILQVHVCQIRFDFVYTDGILVDVTPTVTSVGNIGLEIIKSLSDLNTENKNSFLDAVNENAEKINYIISLRPSDREIFVMCNGDHDEIKIQAALDEVKTGGIVYPVGEVVVLTNANTNKGYSPITTYDVVLKVGSNKTLDFRFCDGVMFDNTNPGDNQAIFQLSQYSSIKNLWRFYESPDTCTAESINPTVLYTANYCIVDNCTFNQIQGVNTNTASQYLFRIGQYCKFRNNILNGISLNNITSSQRGFDFGTGTVVENNLFQNITSSWTAAKVFYFTSCNIEKNVFITFDLGGNTFYISSGFVNNNRFSATNNTYFRFGGIVKGNTFHTITTANEHDTTFLADSNSNVVDNLFYAITANDSYALVTVNSNATFSNKMYNITPPGSADIPIVYLSDSGAVFKENEMRLKSGTDTALVTLTDDWTAAVIKDNITNALSIGTYSSECVVEGNITGFGA